MAVNCKSISSLPFLSTPAPKFLIFSWIAGGWRSLSSSGQGGRERLLPLGFGVEVAMGTPSLEQWNFSFPSSSFFFFKILRCEPCIPSFFFDFIAESYSCVPTDLFLRARNRHNRKHLGSPVSKGKLLLTTFHSDEASRVDLIVT